MVRGERPAARFFGSRSADHGKILWHLGDVRLSRDAIVLGGRVDHVRAFRRSSFDRTVGETLDAAGTTHQHLFDDGRIRMRVMLQIIDGPCHNRRLWLRDSQSVTVGRTSRAEFVLPEDPMVSGIHFTVSCDGKQCHIVDMNSTNGTFVNGVRVNQSQLHDEDVVRIGITRLSVRTDWETANSVEFSQAIPWTRNADPLPPDTLDKEPWHVRSYEQCLDDTSFFLRQRTSLISDQSVSWAALEQLEDRIESHIETLVARRELSADACRRHVASSDANVIETIARVFLRQRNRELFDKLVARTEPMDLARIHGLANAVRDEFPEEWHGSLCSVLDAAGAVPVLVSVKLVSLHRFEVAAALLSVLQKSSDTVLPEVVRTLGRIGDCDAHDRLLAIMRTRGDDSLHTAAALALLQLGDEQVLTECVELLPKEDWPLIPIGRAAGWKTIARLLDRIAKRPDVDGLLALGLLGTIEAVEVLLRSLGDADLQATAALALHLITGANPRPSAGWTQRQGILATVVAHDRNDTDSEPMDETVHLENTRQKMPLGSGENSICTDPFAWRQWCETHREEFGEDRYYRLGKENSPKILVKMLRAPQTPRFLRQIVLDELVIRYNMNLPFDTDLAVRKQQQLLDRLEQWTRTYGSHFEPGVWYFAGQPSLH